MKNTMRNTIDKIIEELEYMELKLGMLKFNLTHYLEDKKPKNIISVDIRKTNNNSVGKRFSIELVDSLLKRVQDEIQILKNKEEKKPEKKEKCDEEEYTCGCKCNDDDEDITINYHHVIENIDVEDLDNIITKRVDDYISTKAYVWRPCPDCRSTMTFSNEGESMLMGGEQVPEPIYTFKDIEEMRNELYENMSMDLKESSNEEIVELYNLYFRKLSYDEHYVGTTKNGWVYFPEVSKIGRKCHEDNT